MSVLRVCTTNDHNNNISSDHARGSGHAALDWVRAALILRDSDANSRQKALPGKHLVYLLGAWGLLAGPLSAGVLVSAPHCKPSILL